LPPVVTVTIRGTTQPGRMGRKANTIPVQTVNAIAPGPISTTQVVGFTTAPGGGDAAILGTQIIATYDSGRTETVYDGTSFTTDYAAGSSAVPQPDGSVEYELIRDGDWPEDVEIELVSYDDEGNRGSDSYAYSVTGGTGFSEAQRLDPLLIRVAP